MTKEGLAARVVDRQQVHRTMSKEEILHLFDFGDEDNSDIIAEVGQEVGISTEPTTNVHVRNLLNQKLPAQPGISSSDKLFESLIGSHHPR